MRREADPGAGQRVVQRSTKEAARDIIRCISSIPVIPMRAMVIAIQVAGRIFSLRITIPMNAVSKGMVALVCTYEPPIFHRHQRIRSRLIMVWEGVNWFALKKCISLESFLSTKMFTF